MRELEDSPTLVTPKVEGQQLLPGAIIAGRYRVQQVLGVGGMGVVYRVYDETLKLDLALKMLRTEIAHDDEFLQRFRNELIIARQVTHSNVVRIHDIGEHSGSYFMTMDMVEGRSLQSMMREDGKFSLDKTLDIVRQIASGLAEAHAKGVVHRDLKPANILLDTEGKVYITDFGIAHSVTGPGLTRTGEVLGTPDYLSPEQARGEKVDGRSDLYTLGLMSLEMLSGKLPFPGGTLFEILAQRMSAQIPTLKEQGIEVPAAYGAIIERCVAKDPNQRYASAEELLADLDDLSRARRALRWRQARKAAPIVGAVVGVALLVAAGFRYLEFRDPPEPPPDGAGPTVEDTAVSFPVPELRHAVAILPFTVTGQGSEGMADWASLWAAEALGQSLATAPDLRHTRLDRVVQALGTQDWDPTQLRDDQLSQLADLFQVDRLVLGTLTRTGDRWNAEARILEPPMTLGTSRPLASEEGSTGELFSLVSRLGGTLRQDLGLDGAIPIGPGPSAEALEAYGLGLEATLRGDATAAIPWLEKAVELAPDLTGARLRLATAYAATGRQAEAVDTARQAAETAAAQGEDSLPHLEAKALEAQLRGRPDEAQEILEARIAAYPTQVEARLALAEAQGAQGRLSDATQRLQEAAELDPTHPETFFLLGRYAIGLGELRQAVDEHLFKALVLYRKSKDKPGQALIHNALGIGYQRLGDPEQAIENYTQAAEIRRDIGDDPELSKTLLNLAWVRLALGEFDTAEGLIQEALDIRTRLDDTAGIAELYNVYGSLEEVRGRIAEALDHYRHALQLRSDLGQDAPLAESHNNVGYSYFTLGEYDNALLYLERALDLFRKTEQPRGVILALQNIGFCRIARGEWSEAGTTFDEALEIARGIGLKNVIAVSLGNLGLVDHYRGSYTEAFAHFSEALAILEEVGDPRGLLEFTLRDAEARLELGDMESAAQGLERAAAWADQGNPEQVALMRRLEGRLALQRDDTAAASSAFDSATEAAEASRSPVARLEAELTQGLGALKRGRPGDASTRLQAAAQQAQRLGHTRLRLRLAETLAEAEILDQNLDGAQSHLREALRLAEDTGEYARTYRLHQLMSEVLEARGEREAAARALRQAVAESERIRGGLDETQKPLFDALRAAQVSQSSQD